MSNERKILLTYKEAAEILRIHQVTLRRWTSEKKISCVRLGGSCVRFRLEDLDNFMVIQEAAE